MGTKIISLHAEAAVFRFLCLLHYGHCRNTFRQFPIESSFSSCWVPQLDIFLTNFSRRNRYGQIIERDTVQARGCDATTVDAVIVWAGYHEIQNDDIDDDTDDDKDDDHDHNNVHNYEYDLDCD